MILENIALRNILCSILKKIMFISDLVSSLNEKKFILFFFPTRIQPYIVCPPDKGKEIITKFVSRESLENDVVESNTGFGRE